MAPKRTTLVEKRARALCAKLARMADDMPMQYRVIAQAIGKAWLIAEGESRLIVMSHVANHGMGATVGGGAYSGEPQCVRATWRITLPPY